MANPFGFTTPFSGWVDPRRNQLMGMAAGLAGGGLGGMWQGGMQGSGLDLEAQERQQQQEQLNQTAEWLKANYPQYAGLPPAEGFRAAMAEMSNAQQASLTGPSYSMTPVFLRDAEGNQHIGQVSGGGGLLVNGEVMPSIPQGWSVVARPDNFGFTDMGGYLGVTDPNTGTVTPGPAMQGSPSSNMNVTGIGPERSMTAAPGSPEALEQQQAAMARESAARQADEKAAYILNAINSATQQSGFWTTGPAGSVGRALGGPGQITLEETVNTIKSNLGFAELQQMRDASPTGGALGQVTERELSFLQNTVASLNPNMGEAALDQNLKLISNLIQRQAVYREIARRGIDIGSPEAQQALSQFPLPGNSNIGNQVQAPAQQQGGGIPEGVTIRQIQ